MRWPVRDGEPPESMRPAGELVPSYRITLQLGQLIPGVAPESVQARIHDICAQVANVEASDIRLERRVPVVVTRFTASSDAEAAEVAIHTRDNVSTFGEIERGTLTKRVKARWFPLPF